MSQVLSKHSPCPLIYSSADPWGCGNVGDHLNEVTTVQRREMSAPAPTLGLESPALWPAPSALKDYLLLWSTQAWGQPEILPSGIHLGSQSGTPSLPGFPTGLQALNTWGALGDPSGLWGQDPSFLQGLLPRAAKGRGLWESSWVLEKVSRDEGKVGVGRGFTVHPKASISI